VRIDQLVGVPHDLWPAADLPAVGLAERVNLIAGQFDLTFELADQGRAIRLVTMPDRPLLQKSYAAANSALVATRVKPMLKQAELEARDGKLIVRGSAEEHEIVESMLSGKTVRQTTVTPGTKVYQLNIVMPVRRLIKELGPKLDLEVELDEPAIQAAGLNLDQDVKVTVKNVTEDQLLSAVLDPAGLAYKRAGKKLIVRPKQE
jgi:hypothetical protein